MEYKDTTITAQKGAIDVQNAIFNNIGKRPPVQFVRENGKVKSIQIGESWKEGYEEPYTEVSLTAEEKQVIQDWFAANYPNLTAEVS